MKTYKKIHSTKKVAGIHQDKIKKRGGTASMKPVQGGFQVEYYFPEKSVSKKKTPKMKAANKKTGASKKRYDVISPDGISIRIGVPPFNSEKERENYFEMWKNRFARQGYYSSNSGHIPLDELAAHCDWVTL